MAAGPDLVFILKLFQKIIKYVDVSGKNKMKENRIF